MLLVVVGFLLAGSETCAEPAQRDAALSRAMEALSQGRVFEAIAGLREIVGQDPSYRPAYFYLATLYTEMGQYERAGGYLERARVSDPDQGWYHYQEGVIRFRQRNWKGALAALEHALELGMAGNEADAWRYIGEVQIELFDWDRAVEAYENAIRIQPEDPMTRLAIGNIHLDRNEPEPAGREFRRAIEIQPSLSEAHAALGRLHSHLGNLSEAVETFRRALELDPSNQESRYGLGRALLAAGDTAEGQRLFEEYRQIDETVTRADSMFDSAIDLIDAGNLETARTLLEEVRILAPTFSRGLHALGFVLTNLGAAERAAPILEEAIRINPLASATYLDLGAAYIMTGRYVEALDTTRRAIVLDDENPLSYRQLGDVYQTLERISEANAAYERADELPSPAAPRGFERTRPEGMGPAPQAGPGGLRP